MRQEVAAQIGDDVEPEGANRCRIVAETLQLAADPARDLRAAGVREARQLGKAQDRHDSRHDRRLDPGGDRLVDEVIVAVGVEEILGDRRVGAGVDLALEVGEILARISGLRMIFRVRRDFDVEPVARRRADEFDQFVRIAQFADVGRSRRQVTAQRDQMSDAVLAIRRERCPYALAGRTDARDMRRRALPRRLDLQHGRERTVARRAARAEGDRKELWSEPLELLARGAQLGHALRRRWRKEFEAEDAVRAFGHTPERSRWPSSNADSAQEMMLYRMAPKTADQKPAT